MSIRFYNNLCLAHTRRAQTKGRYKNIVILATPTTVFSIVSHSL